MVQGEKISLPNYGSELNALLSLLRNPPLPFNMKKAEFEYKRQVWERNSKEARLALEVALQHVELSSNYLTFDLEATRRERNHLRKMLAEINGNK